MGRLFIRSDNYSAKVCTFTTVENRSNDFEWSKDRRSYLNCETTAIIIIVRFSKVKYIFYKLAQLRKN